MPATDRLTTSLCLKCALCCNGVLFQDVQLQPGEAAARLSSLRLRHRRGRLHLLQPCAALKGSRCRCYADRPTHCRQFECLLFRAVAEGRVAHEEALRVIRRARRRAGRVRTLLRTLGNHRETDPLERRFREVTRRLERSGATAAQADAFAELTQQLHALNLILSDRFYREPSEGAERMYP